MDEPHSNYKYGTDILTKLDDGGSEQLDQVSCSTSNNVYLISHFRPKRSYGMGLSVCLSVTPLLQRVQSHMSKGNKGNKPEHELEAEAKQALRTSLYKVYREYFEAQFTSYTLLITISLCFEKRCVMYQAARESDGFRM
jgi:hypothetical protein